MSKRNSYHFLMIGLTAVLGMIMSAGLANGQVSPNAPTQEDIYCSGVATDQPVPADTYLISGENSHYRSTFSQGDNVFINRGASQGVKVGDRI